jgi:hypothetical protein
MDFMKTVAPEQIGQLFSFYWVFILQFWIAAGSHKQNQRKSSEPAHPHTFLKARFVQLVWNGTQTPTLVLGRTPYGHSGGIEKRGKALWI